MSGNPKARLGVRAVVVAPDWPKCQLTSNECGKLRALLPGPSKLSQEQFDAVLWHLQKNYLTNHQRYQRSPKASTNAAPPKIDSRNKKAPTPAEQRKALNDLAAVIRRFIEALDRLDTDAKALFAANYTGTHLIGDNGDIKPGLSETSAALCDLAESLELVANSANSRRKPTKALAAAARKASTCATGLAMIDDYSEAHLLNDLVGSSDWSANLLRPEPIFGDNTSPRYHIDRRYAALRQLTMRLQVVAEAARSAANRIEVQRGARPNIALRETVASLCQFWKDVTGAEPTNCYSDYEPQRPELASPFGKFSARFFELVDPSVSRITLHRTVTEAIRVRKSRSPEPAKIY